MTALGRRRFERASARTCCPNARTARSGACDSYSAGARRWYYVIVPRRPGRPTSVERARSVMAGLAAGANRTNRRPCGSRDQLLSGPGVAGDPPGGPLGGTCTMSCCAICTHARPK